MQHHPAHRAALPAPAILATTLRLHRQACCLQNHLRLRVRDAKPVLLGRGEEVVEAQRAHAVALAHEQRWSDGFDVALMLQQTNWSLCGFGLLALFGGQLVRPSLQLWRLATPSEVNQWLQTL